MKTYFLTLDLEISVLSGRIFLEVFSVVVTLIVDAPTRKSNLNFFIFFIFLNQLELIGGVDLYMAVCRKCHLHNAVTHSNGRSSMPLSEISENIPVHRDKALSFLSGQVVPTNVV